MQPQPGPAAHPAQAGTDQALQALGAKGKLVKRGEQWVEATTLAQEPMAKQAGPVAVTFANPLAFGVGSGSEMERPLAIAVIGGLSTATVFTLVLIPVLYAAVARRQPIRTHLETARL